MGESAWHRVRFGQENLSALRSKLTLHIGLINQFMESVTSTTVGQMEPMLREVLAILRESARRSRSTAQSIVSAQNTDEEEVWAPLEFELMTEGIPQDYIRQNRDQIRSVLHEAIEEVGAGASDNIALGESASQLGPSSEAPRSVDFPSDNRPVARDFTAMRAADIPLNATPAEIEQAKIALKNAGFELNKVTRSKLKFLAGIFRNDDTSSLAEQALCWAVENGSETAVRLLLKNGVNPSSRARWQPALGLAAATGNESIVRLLLEVGADIEARFGIDYWGGCTALYVAVSKGHENVVRLLLSRGAKIDVRDFDGKTPLHVATHNSNESMVKLLVQNRAMLNVEAGLTRKETPLDLIVYPQGTKIHNFLVSVGARHGKYYERTHIF